MAQISLAVSTAAQSIIDVSKLEKEGDCLSIHLDTNLEGYNGQPVPYSHDWITIHGTVADIRALCVKMLSALPARTDAEAAEDIGNTSAGALMAASIAAAIPASEVLERYQEIAVLDMATPTPAADVIEPAPQPRPIIDPEDYPF